MLEQDDELELKKRARRRLLGAATFAIVAVALLPLVMDEQPPPLGVDIPVRIPGQEQTLPLPAAKKPAAPAQVDSGVPVGAPSQGLAEPSQSPLESPEEKPAVAEKAGEPKTAVTKPAESSAAEEARRAQAILEGRVVKSEYVVLIGAFAEASNVKTLTAKLDDLGIKTYTENVTLPQGKRTRVRAGPFDTQDEARRAAEKMKRIGVNGVVANKP